MWGYSRSGLDVVVREDDPGLVPLVGLRFPDMPRRRRVYLQEQIGVGTLVSSQEQKALLVQVCLSTDC